MVTRYQLEFDEERVEKTPFLTFRSAANVLFFFIRPNEECEFLVFLVILVTVAYRAMLKQMN